MQNPTDLDGPIKAMKGAQIFTLQVSPWMECLCVLEEGELSIP